MAFKKESKEQHCVQYLIKQEDGQPVEEELDN